MKLKYISLFLLCISCNISSDNSISKGDLIDKFEGFWLGQSIANWTGIVTEMDKIGEDDSPFYTREDWGKLDQPNIWSETTQWGEINFKYASKDSVWGSDDDTDIEYMYQELILEHDNIILTPNQIKNGWLKHIKHDEENFLWVSNQKAFDLMKSGILPPETSSPKLNPFFEMIDAQLTTEIFGLFSPSYPDHALKISNLPIRTVARKDAAWISEFYVIMHSLAYSENFNDNYQNKIMWMAENSRKILPEDSYASKMYDFVKRKYQNNIPWEEVRDSLNQRYQVDNMDGYDVAKRDKECGGCFAAGINFGASLISLFYGEGDYKETIKIATLCGWDSDNPASTWGGLLGFMYGKKKIVELFKVGMSNSYNIHRTRINFQNNGMDNFNNMANKSVQIFEKVINEEFNGYLKNNKFVFDKKQSKYSNELEM